MKFSYPVRHPGPFRTMQVDSEVAGILVALGFVVMAVVGIPLARWFVLGTVLMGISVALVLRFTRKYSLACSIARTIFRKISYHRRHRGEAEPEGFSRYFNAMCFYVPWVEFFICSRGRFFFAVESFKSFRSDINPCLTSDFLCAPQCPLW